MFSRLRRLFSVFEDPMKIIVEGGAHSLEMVTPTTMLLNEINVLFWSLYKSLTLIFLSAFLVKCRSGKGTQNKRRLNLFPHSRPYSLIEVAKWSGSPQFCFYALSSEALFDRVRHLKILLSPTFFFRRLQWVLSQSYKPVILASLLLIVLSSFLSELWSNF